MSLILEALKKSDKKRQEASAPRLDTVHEPAPVKKARPRWYWLLLVIVLLNAGILLWLAVPQKQPSVVQPEQALAHVRPVAKEITAHPAQETSQPAVQPPLPEVARAVAPKRSTAPQSTQPVGASRIYAIAELPSSVQRRLPSLHMSLHAYSRAGGSASLVRINDRILRSGEQLDAKIRLEEILIDGAVLSFEGYRFLVPRKRTGGD